MARRQIPGGQKRIPLGAQAAAGKNKPVSNRTGGTAAAVQQALGALHTTEKYILAGLTKVIAGTKVETDGSNWVLCTMY